MAQNLPTLEEHLVRTANGFVKAGIFNYVSFDDQRPSGAALQVSTRNKAARLPNLLSPCHQDSLQLALNSSTRKIFSLSGKKHQITSGLGR
jgi:hypothetical protein